MAQPDQSLVILAQPKASSRERYSSEMNRTHRRALRYIRAEPNPQNFEHPTVAIPAIWRGRRIHIRVTLTTVPTEQVPVVCVHPYPIDGPDANKMTDSSENAINFLVSDEDFEKGFKSFRIVRQKLAQYQLRHIERLRLLDTHELDQPRVSYPGSARSLIETYQLGKSRLHFCIVEINEHSPMVIFKTTSIYSHTMSGTTNSNTGDNSAVRCAPRKGAWSGGDDVLMFIPDVDRRRSYEVSFEYSSSERVSVATEWVDTKTIGFRTPCCRRPAGVHQRIPVSIVITQNGTEIVRVDFLYQNDDNQDTSDEYSPDRFAVGDHDTGLDAPDTDHETFFEDHKENLLREFY